MGCFGSVNNIRPRPGDPAGVDQAPTYVPVSYPRSVLLGKDRTTQSASPELLCREWRRLWHVEGLGSVGGLQAGHLLHLTRSKTCALHQTSAVPNISFCRDGILGRGGTVGSAYSLLEWPSQRPHRGLLGFFLTEDAGWGANTAPGMPSTFRRSSLSCGHQSSPGCQIHHIDPFSLPLIQFAAMHLFCSYKISLYCDDYL